MNELEPAEHERQRLLARLSELGSATGAPAHRKAKLKWTDGIFVGAAIFIAALVIWPSDKSGSRLGKSDAPVSSPPLSASASLSPAEQVANPPSDIERAAFRSEYGRLVSHTEQCEKSWGSISGIVAGDAGSFTMMDSLVALQDCGSAAAYLQQFEFSDAIGVDRARKLNPAVHLNLALYQNEAGLLQKFSEMIRAGLSQPMIYSHTEAEMKKLAPIQERWANAFFGSARSLGFSDDLDAVLRGDGTATDNSTPVDSSNLRDGPASDSPVAAQ